MSRRECDALERAARKYAGDAFVKLACDGNHEDSLHQLAMLVLDMMIARAPQAEHQNFNIATGVYFGDHDPTPFDLYADADKIFAAFPPRPKPSAAVERDGIPF